MFFTACVIDGISNATATVRDDSSINVSWDPVLVGPGFDPSSGIGSYGVSLWWTPSYATVFASDAIAEPHYVIPYSEPTTPMATISSGPPCPIWRKAPTSCLSLRRRALHWGNPELATSARL